MTPIIRHCTVSHLEQCPDLPALLEAYGEESAIVGIGAPSAQLDAYRAMEAAGLAHLIAAFVDGAMVGFINILIGPLPHYGTVIATTESFFVSPAHRKSGAGMFLLREAESLAHERGATGLLVSAPSGGRLDAVLSRSNYRETNRVYFRALQ
jgi:GNAT superfamily N-acetyltransferase